ncbi:hypothetical protein [Phormidium nigroviride]
MFESIGSYPLNAFVEANLTKKGLGAREEGEEGKRVNWLIANYPSPPSPPSPPSSLSTHYLRDCGQGMFKSLASSSETAIAP